MPTNACSVHMPIGRDNFKVRGVRQDSVSYMIKIVFTNIPVKCVVADSNVNRLLYISGYAMVLPPYDVEVLRCGIVSSLGPVCMDGTEFLQVFLTPFPQGPKCFPYVFFIVDRFPTLVHLDSSTFLDYRILIFGFD